MRYSRSHTPPGRADGGLGIGLSLVKGIAELHGASVEARSEVPGRGSVFIVKSLPLRFLSNHARRTHVQTLVERRKLVRCGQSIALHVVDTVGTQ